MERKVKKNKSGREMKKKKLKNRIINSNDKVILQLIPKDFINDYKKVVKKVKRNKKFRKQKMIKNEI